MRSFSSFFDSTRIFRRNVRVILPNRVSTMFSQEPCVGVSTYLNRLGRVAKQLTHQPRSSQLPQDMSAAVKYAVKTRETGVSIRLEETLAGRTHMDVGAAGFSLNLTDLRNA